VDMALDPRKSQMGRTPCSGCTVFQHIVTTRLFMNATQEEDVAIIDVREPKDFKRSHFPGAISLPQEKWKTCAGLRRHAINIIYCYAQICHMGAHAAMQFAAKGYSIMEMDGGFKSWKENGLKTVK